jgi:transcriptional regulator of acetoin/glycerol metabolism
MLDHAPHQAKASMDDLVLDGSAHSAAVLASWRRCEAAGLARSARPRIEVLTDHEVAQRRQRAERVHRLAHAELQTLARQIAGSNFLLAFADPDGVILELTSDQRFMTSGSGARIQLGSVWTESAAGTNGLGTALACGSAAAIDGSDHYFHSLRDITCTAAPVRNGQGEVVGVLDASSYVRSRQMHTLALVQMSAMQIENRLLLQEMQREVVLAIHPRPEFLGTLSAGLLAFDHGGRILAFNDRAAKLLSGLTIRIGTAFETLFPEGFGPACRRLGGGAAQPLTDALGSTVAAQLTRGPTHPLATMVPHAWSPASPPAAATAQSPAPPQAANAGSPLPALASSAGPELVADDARVDKALKLARRAVRMGVPLLIQGETGTGKELLARHAHAFSGRKGSFVAVNCGALPAELIEAELFGYVGGAFTGARREGSAGLIASADGGTLLLDEIAELPLALQASLLRFLDDAVVRPVGGTQGRKVDVQLLAASLSNLHELAATGRFRKDLLYRLDVAQVRLPPLRERSDFAQAVALTLHRIQPGLTVDDEALARLRRHDWPGNFRELRALLTRALLEIDPQGADIELTARDVALHLPPQASGATSPGPTGKAGSPGALLSITQPWLDHQTPLAASQAFVSHGHGMPTHGRSLRLHEAATQAVAHSYHRHGGNVSLVARELGISRTTAYRHLRQAGLHGDGATQP